MSVVVRCPNCRGASQVAPEAVGLLVVCPNCNDPFLAIEEAPAVAPPPPRSSARPVSRGEFRNRAAPPPRRRKSAEPVEPHDPPHAVGLPVSVLVGLALLPFAIPLLWMIAPLMMGQEAVLSLAAPTALAVAASALCLAVVYTVDWSPATRIKGVLMLVGLAYFTGLSLFYLKKDMVDRVKGFFGADRDRWVEYSPPDRGYRVRLPVRPEPARDQPLAGFTLSCQRATEKTFAGQSMFVVGHGPDPKPDLPADGEQWFNEVDRLIQANTRGAAVKVEAVTHQDEFPGRQWEMEFRKPGGATVRIVQVYRMKGTVYYLAAEGPNLSAEEGAGLTFFESFLANVPKK